METEDLFPLETSHRLSVSFSRASQFDGLIAHAMCVHVWTKIYVVFIREIYVEHVRDDEETIRDPNDLILTYFPITSRASFKILTILLLNFCNFKLKF